MKKITMLIMIGFLTFAFGAGDIDKGQKFYLKSLKSSCKVTGAKFAVLHTQDEWSELYNSKKLNEEINKECGREFKISDDNLGYLYKFFFEYASDSGNVPSCG